MDKNWFYPEAPVENVFGSHPSYDEARGPDDPNGFITIGEMSSEGYVPFCDPPEDDAIGLDDGPEDSDESVPDEQILAALQLYAETTWNWWTTLKTMPIVETKVCLKEFDRRVRRWRRVPRYLPLTV